MTKKGLGLYLGEIAKRDEITYGSNNLIISPVGSGKTHFIMNTLAPEYKGKKLMLVSTTSLKDSLGNLVGTFTTQDLRRSQLELTDESIYVMTYSEFGDKVAWKSRKKFISEYEVIFCDEIHSLFDYFFINESYKLAAAINLLFEVNKGLDIYYFTATTGKIERFINNFEGDLYSDIKVINYNNDFDIKRYYDSKVEEFSDVSEIEEVICSLKDFKAAGQRGVIFNERIDGMEKIEKMLEMKGYKSVSIWSVNNKKNKMNEEQLEARNELLLTGMIPEKYDFIIINGAMREGWNLLDESVEVVIINTTDETSRIQARGRVRKDIFFLFVRAICKAQPLDIRVMSKEKTLRVIESVLGEELTSEDKDELSVKLNVKREKDGLLIGWRTISKILLSNGYNIEEVRKRVDGKQLRFSVITKIEDNSKATVSRANNFVSELDDKGFTKANSAYLEGYMKLGKGTAFKHIMSSYKRFVLEGDWSERKFADTTYLIAKDEGLFSAKTYANYIESDKFTEIEILSERAKYEKAALGLLKKAQAVQEQDADTKEQELLAYINSMTV